MVDLGTLGGIDSHATAVSNGQVVGCGRHRRRTLHAFSWTQAGGMVDLGTLGRLAVAGQRRQQRAGGGLCRTRAGGGVQHAFSWTPAGGMVDLGTLGGPTSDATAVSNGQVVGVADVQPRQHARGALDRSAAPHSHTRERPLRW